MADADDIAAGLPTPNEDEPSSLRRDILDELRDHLHCATRREQCLGAADERVARLRAYQKFGDPRVIATRLYWLAMWRTVMRQRLVLAGVAACLATCLGIFGLLWTMLVRQQQMMVRQHEVMERLLAKLIDAPTASDPGGTVESVRPVAAAQPVEPATIYGSLIVSIDQPAQLSVSGGALKDPIEYRDVEIPAGQTTHDVDFGELSPGVYKIVVSSRNRRCEKQAVIRSGRTHREVVQVDPVPQVEVAFSTNLPSGVLDRLPFILEWDTRQVNGMAWTPHADIVGYVIGGPDKVSTITVNGSGPARLRFGYTTDSLSFCQLGAIKFNSYVYHGDNSCASCNDLSDRIGDRIVSLDIKPGRNECHVDFPHRIVELLTMVSSVDLPRLAQQIETALANRSQSAGAKNSSDNAQPEAAATDASASNAVAKPKHRPPQVLVYVQETEDSTQNLFLGRLRNDLATCLMQSGGYRVRFKPWSELMASYGRAISGPVEWPLDSAQLLELATWGEPEGDYVLLLSVDSRGIKGQPVLGDHVVGITIWDNQRSSPVQLTSSFMEP